MASHNMQHRKRAFTLIELLVVIAIISILATILIPALSQAREMAKQVKCTGNLHVLGSAMAMYASDENGQYPDILKIAQAVAYPNMSGMWAPSWGPAKLIKGEYLSSIESLICPANDSTPIWWAPEYDNKTWYMTHYNYWATMRVENFTKSKTEIIAPEGSLSPADHIVMTDMCNQSVTSKTNHRDSTGKSLGANRLYVGMNVEWVPTSDLELIYPSGILSTPFPGADMHLY